MIHQANDAEEDNEIERMSRNPELIKRVKEAEKNYKKGKTVKMNTQELKEFLDI